MICPQCKKPYLFVDSQAPDTAVCLRCSHREPFRQPDYDQYHETLYIKPYRRDRFSDPQMKRILKVLHLEPSDSVLDLGCGVGDYTKAISEYTGNVVGIDLSVAAARNKYPGLEFRDHDLNAPVPFPEGHFDTVVSINVIEHLRHATDFLDECARVLKPSGTIAMTTANLDFFLHDRFYDKTHVHEWNLGQFRELMERHFETIIVEKSSSMFNYYPLNFITTRFLKPDLLFVGTKR